MESTKKYLRSLLTANPIAMTIHQVNNEYRNTIGEPIPYTKFGFTSLEQFLQSIPDTVQLQGTGQYALVNLVVSEKSSHVLELVSRQKVERKKGLRYPVFKRTVVSQQSFFKNHAPSTTRPQSQKIIYPNPKIFNSTIQSESSTSNKNMLSNSFTPFKNSNETQTRETNMKTLQWQSKDLNTKPIAKCPGELKSGPTNGFTEYVNKNQENIEKMIEDMKISNKVAHNIQRMNKSHMPNDCEEVEDDYCSSGKTESRASSSSMSNKIDVSQVSNQSEECVPITVRNNLKKLIDKFPDGIWCAELPEVYRKMFKREIKYNDLGFRNLIDLCTCLKSIFHYVRPSTEDFKLYDRSKPLPKTAEQVFTAASYSSSRSLPSGNVHTSALPNIDWSDVLLFIPPNVFKPGQEIPRTFVPETTTENETMEIVVGEVFDVSKFWVYRDDGQLDALMDDIQTFYAEHAEAYRIPKHLIREGLYCVCIIFGEYHRGLVVNAMCEGTDEIRIFYIDYGTIKKEKPDIFFLDECFAKLPAQTIRCRLANICPPVKGAPWTRECTEAFKAMIKNRNITAKIHRINWKDQYLEISLADVSEINNVFCINNVLVEKGHAIFVNQEQKISIVGSICNPIVNFIHLFPTFMELEHGLAPSTSEMETYASCNIPINFCYPQYFSFDHSEEEKIIESVTNFYESHILKGLRPEIHRNFSVDVNKITEKPIDFSHFMELEDELKDFWENSWKDYEEENASAEETVEDPNLVLNISKKIEMWKTEAISELQTDRELTEDIMNELSNVCRSNEESEHNNEVIQKDLGLIEYNDSLLIKNSDLLDTDSNCTDYEDVSNHPFNNLSFSRSVSSNGSVVSDYPTRDSLQDSMSDDVKIPKLSSDILSVDSENFGKSSEAEEISLKENKITENHLETDTFTLHPTNPFLVHLLDSENDEHDVDSNKNGLHPSNPFLEYIPEEKDSYENSESSLSALANETNMSICATINHSVDSINNFCFPSTSVSIEEIKDEDINSPTIRSSYSSQPPIIKTCNVQSETMFDINQPTFYPPTFYPPYPIPPFYPYPYFPPPHPAFCNNPYYSQQMNTQLFLTSAIKQKTNRPTPPLNRMAICPPPGFAPNSNIFSTQSNHQDFYEAHNEMLMRKYNS